MESNTESVEQTIQTEPSQVESLTSKRSREESDQEEKNSTEEEKKVVEKNTEEESVEVTKRVKQDTEVEVKPSVQQTPATVVNSSETNITKMITATVSSLETTPSPVIHINSVLSPSGDSEMIEISPDKVGSIIGSKGMIIQDLQNRSGAKIYVNQNFPEGVNRQVNITGNPLQVKAASELIKKIITDGPTSIHVNSIVGGPTLQITIECPQPIVGRIIGSNGATIKELQSRSGAKIQINQDFPDGVNRKILIMGTQAAVTTATHLVSYVMENGPNLPPSAGSNPFNSNPFSNAGAYGGNPYNSFPGSNFNNPYNKSMGNSHPNSGGAPAFGANSNINNPPGVCTHLMECPKSLIGKVIGKGGEVINSLQEKSGTKMQIDQNVPVGMNCKISITGSPQGIGMSVQLINEIISGINFQPRGGEQNNNNNNQNNHNHNNHNNNNNPYNSRPQQHSHQQQHSQPQPYGGYSHSQTPYAASPYASQAYGHPANGASHSGNPVAHGYGNPVNNSSQYPPMAPMAPKPLPKFWSEHKTDDGNTYWHNSNTGVSQWERPV